MAQCQVQNREGKQGSFCCVKWCSEIPFKDLYRILYEAMTHKEASFKKYWYRNRWILIFENRQSSRANEEWRRLKLDIVEYRPKDYKEDCPIWRWDKKVSFSVNSTYNHFIDGAVDHLSHIRFGMVSAF